MKPEVVLERLKTVSRGYGFNIVQTIRVGAYDNIVSEQKSACGLFPGARSITLIGFGGNAFWNTFIQYIKDNPDFKERGKDLIDNYSLMVFQELSEVLDDSGVKHKSIYPFGADGTVLDFVKLGVAAGAGVPSLLGILLSPVYGPWISLRGALLTDLNLSRYGSPLRGFNPCPACHKPCISACPASTVSENGWDWESCMAFRLAEDTCSGNCASRRACPYGKDLQYSDEQLAYHHSFVLRNIKKYYQEGGS
jgi:hypothetical protein